MESQVPREQFRNQRGFTLVEVLVAITLLATIAAMVFGSLVTTTHVIDAGRERSAQEQTVRRILRLMADELSLSTRANEYPWIGVNGTWEGRPADTVAILTPGQGIVRSAIKESDLIRVVYAREGDRLIRYVRRNIYGLTDESIHRQELADQVKGFNLRYFDAQMLAWTDEWAVPKMPKAMLIEVTFDQPNTDPWTVREWVTIGTS